MLQVIAFQIQLATQLLRKQHAALQWRDSHLRAQLLMGRNNGIEKGFIPAPDFLDLKSSLYFFVWIVNPVGQPGQKAEMAGVRHRVCGENKHYWAFSGTIFYLFALSKVPLWAYLMRRRIINKIMLASFTYTVWASLSFPIRNGAG
ncbi:hypothetical protein QEP77_22925 [Serratia sp. B1]|nr:hypothetical protein QEP77_22925 [Serratia sp. B1]